ncbi:hypothetical protein [Rhodopirellula halodulae]|uniref:hypothetical protein n=1 Tax=Rhodopirellula halodulae TaxID=2894198 RepID=UPI001E37D946|nr:hypothetical protein [Rhodopirellula sp. JC737]MCC9658427.1 hypothetical protein [Rhodopirellula sp. JC737]
MGRSKLVLALGSKQELVRSKLVLVLARSKRELEQVLVRSKELVQVLARSKQELELALGSKLVLELVRSKLAQVLRSKLELARSSFSS